MVVTLAKECLGICGMDDTDEEAKADDDDVTEMLNADDVRGFVKIVVVLAGELECMAFSMCLCIVVVLLCCC